MLADRMGDMAHPATSRMTMMPGSDMGEGRSVTTAQENREEAGDLMSPGGTPPPRSVEQAGGDQRTDVMATDWAPEDESSGRPTETGSGLA